MLDREDNADFTSESDEDIDETVEPINEVHISKRVHEDCYNFEVNVGSYGYPLHKKQCVYGDTSAFETMEQEQHLTSTHQIFEELMFQQNKGWLPSSPNQLGNVNQDEAVLRCQMRCCKNQQLYSKKHVEDMVGFDNNDGWIADINGDKDSRQQLFESSESMGRNNLTDLFSCPGDEEQSRQSPSSSSLTQDEEVWDPVELKYEIMCGNDQLGQNDKCQNKDKDRGMMGTQDDKH